MLSAGAAVAALHAQLLCSYTAECQHVRPGVGPGATGTVGVTTAAKGMPPGSTSCGIVAEDLGRGETV